MRGEPKLLLAFLATVLLLIANGYAARRSIDTVLHNDRRVAHTHQVLTALEALLSTVTDAETGQRGYVLTGRDSYLQPYRAARGSMGGRLAEIRALTTDNPRQQARIPVLQGTIRAKLAELGETIGLRRTGGMEAALPVIESDRGARLMDEIRALLDSMEAEERRLLEIRALESDRSASTLLITIGVADFVAIAFLAAFTFLAIRRMAEQRRSARELAEQRDWLETTLASLGDAVLATDQDGAVRLLNPVAESLLGWTQAEAAGRSLGEVFRIVNEETREPAEDPVSKALREGVVVGLANHTAVISRDGVETPIEDSAAPIKDSSGKVLGVVLVFRDVSERKHFERERDRLAEEERLARVHAEEANRAKDEFLATVSHELRTPLNAIAGWTVILRTGPMSQETCGHAAEVIERNARALAKIVEDILDVSRIVTGKLRVEAREMEITPVVKAAIESLRPAAEAKQILLETDLQESGPVWGDPDRLQQVVWNLVANAVKFTPKGGTVAVRLHQAASQVEIAVRDSGVGIPGALLPHVFDRFRQADSSTTRRYGGLGLGLAIVRHLVEMHGGTVAVTSTGSGQGSTFTVQLPIRALRSLPADAGPLEAEAVSAGPPRPDPAEPVLRGLRILVVEDDPDSLEMICTLLAQRGAQVRPAASAAEAFDALDEWRPDLLVSDLGMPGEDGLGLIRRVRALPAERGGQIPAIALSAHVRPEDQTSALSAGFQTHVAKPVEPLDLVAAAASLALRTQVPPGPEGTAGEIALHP